MPKAQPQTEVAESNDAVQDTPTGPRTIAEWKGTERRPRVDRASVRRITRKEAKDSLLMTLTRDLEWGPGTAYRADITDEPDSFKEWMAGQKEFKVTTEE